MLHPNAQKRLSVEQIWRHPWVYGSLNSEQIKQFENLEQISKSSVNECQQIGLSLDPKQIDAY